MRGSKHAMICQLGGTELCRVPRVGFGGKLLYVGITYIEAVVTTFRRRTRQLMPTTAPLLSLSDRHGICLLPSHTTTYTHLHNNIKINMSSSSQGHHRRNRLSVIVSQITKRVIHNPYRDHPHIKGLRYVIFPNNVYLQWWDFLMILAVIYYSFALPWQFGIGGGCEFFCCNAFVYIYLLYLTLGLL
jgi:hypothetical protein